MGIIHDLAKAQAELTDLTNVLRTSTDEPDDIDKAASRLIDPDPEHAEQINSAMHTVVAMMRTWMPPMAIAAGMQQPLSDALCVAKVGIGGIAPSPYHGGFHAEVGVHFVLTAQPLDLDDIDEILPMFHQPCAERAVVAAPCASPKFMVGLGSKRPPGSLSVLAWHTDDSFTELYRNA